MTKGRLEAVTDGVIAIIITIMVLELKVPQGSDAAALTAALPVFLAYVLSYVNVGIFWNNHHHMLHATERIDGGVMWANLALLFWLSLVPLVIRWIGEAGFAALPAAMPDGVPSSGHVPFDSRTMKVMELTLREALALGHNYIGTEHILLGLLEEEESLGGGTLTGLGITKEQTLAWLLPVLEQIAAAKGH